MLLAYICRPDSCSAVMIAICWPCAETPRLRATARMVAAWPSSVAVRVRVEPPVVLTVSSVEPSVPLSVQLVDEPPRLLPSRIIRNIV